MDTTPWLQPEAVQQAVRLGRSYRQCVGQSLLPEWDPAIGEWDLDDPGAIAWAKALFAAPRIVVSHGTQADPIFNYGNRAALTLWEMTWADLTQMPSRYTAEPVNREERARMLAQAETQGYINNYCGVRISTTGRRFEIQDGLIWTVRDAGDRPCGQAATFSRYEFLT
jgi:hypothetical protein